MSKIYTKKGDEGKTGTIGSKLSKADLLPEVLGSLDETNSWVGLCRQQIKPTIKGRSVTEELEKIQNDLLTIGSGLAGSDKKISELRVEDLERLIDSLTDELPVLNNFILPTGSGGAAVLHIARTVARRTERMVVKYVESTNQPEKYSAVLKYINRLSDTLYVMARYINMTVGGKETIWNKEL